MAAESVPNTEASINNLPNGPTGTPDSSALPPVGFDTMGNAMQGSVTAMAGNGDPLLTLANELLELTFDEDPGTGRFESRGDSRFTRGSTVSQRFASGNDVRAIATDEAAFAPASGGNAGDGAIVGDVGDGADNGAVQAGIPQQVLSQVVQLDTAYDPDDSDDTSQVVCLKAGKASASADGKAGGACSAPVMVQRSKTRRIS